MSIKRKVQLAVTTALILLASLPIFNLSQSYLSENVKFDKASLFNADKLITLAQLPLYYLGISLNPQKTFIGQEGWFFLGDEYASSISTRRQGVTLNEKRDAISLNKGLSQWNQFLKSKGVDSFFVMMGPDKATIYPEHLPNWAKPQKTTRTDALFYKGNAGLIIDTRPSLLHAKKHLSHPLYYQTDTHWNSIGAGIAFQSFISTLAKNNQIKGRWLNNNQIQLIQINTRVGGDLSQILRISNHLTDKEPIIKIAPKKSLNIEVRDYLTGELESSAGNLFTPIAKDFLIVKNHNALNNKKVLWLRDSFGPAVLPYMAATFSDVLKIHYNNVKSKTMIEIINTFKPDYVFMTVVERRLTSLNIGLRELPSTVFSLHNNSHLNHSVPTYLAGLNHLEHKTGKYNVTNETDPYAVFKLPNIVTTTKNTKVGFNLECENKNNEVNLQLFWHKKGTPGFTQENSIRFKSPMGNITLDLKDHLIWLNARQITALRIDLDPVQECHSFTLTPPRVGS